MYNDNIVVELPDLLKKLPVTILLNCLSQADKEKLIKDLGEEFYSVIVQKMRQESSIIAMRNFHNWIKLTFLKNIADNYKKTKNLALLDIACGRGGDLIKWQKANISHVFAFDPSFESIYSDLPDDPGAISRLKKLKDYNVNVQFELGDATQPYGELMTKVNSFLKKINRESFDLIECNFALQYFFSSRESLTHVIWFVSMTLKPGGYFFGTCIDGKKVVKYNNNNPLIEIHKNNDTEYTFTINDIFDKTNYFTSTGVSKEYIVDFNELESICSDFGMELVKQNFFERKKNGNGIISFEKIFPLWKPNNDYTRPITPQEKDLSFMYSVFCFKKKVE